MVEFVGCTVTDQLLPEVLVACVLCVPTIAKTKFVCGVAVIVNVTLWPDVIVVRSTEKLVTAGAAEATSGNTAINNATNIVAVSVLISFELFKIHHS